MNSGLVMHWSKRMSVECQVLQSAEMSLHTGAQIPQLVGQMDSLRRGGRAVGRAGGR
jgi:hypothetical protein